MSLQAAIVSRKKEAAAEQMEQQQAELSRVLSELEDKRQKSAAYADTHAVLRGEEFKQYVTKLRWVELSVPTNLEICEFPTVKPSVKRNSKRMRLIFLY